MGTGSSSVDNRTEAALQEERRAVASLTKQLAQERADKAALWQQGQQALALGFGTVVLGCCGFAVLLRRQAAAKTAAERMYAQQLADLKRRSALDLESAQNFAITAFARDLLTVGDSLEEACKHARQARQATSEASSGNEGLADGVLLTEQSFLAALGKHGIQKQDALGKAFDPNWHEALMRVSDSTVEPGSVTQVLRSGFCINGRVLRAAQVAIAFADSADKSAAGDTESCSSNEKSAE
eukprot:TRINITY_DN104402_c0_g1_i1.p1 TRINITY_DN104402_c0_g1~~TRINITY_DN104402_c0_g1_i1.p1  ORF type:complete len:253 (+),score=70.75 TRINITY_DN104402_c0_g1_i1:42-761(+)